ncbi:uncharacterized protein BCR38DRAFT_210006 [Pseudomassariella vexata]|uniref:Chromo domain-containing protein n=1 Tax=Pseudomassariella vexata TaxID=1141098 RepID=A0A1Y2DY56_9PEZI|nr:uncharacterized protein BCR38DRAFT_210006 [Pseudomassariella vexata]ORY64232.1 hypothetical protein BCR38DRAFT_210006 [Pseudomassariella vexata]
MASGDDAPCKSTLFVSTSDESSDDDDISLTSAIVDAEDKEYVADGILAERPDEKRPGQLEYLIQWEDYPLDQCTWEPRENLSEGLHGQWEEQKRQVAAGNWIPFDMQLYYDAVVAESRIYAERHMRRNAKRQKLGLPLTYPFPPDFVPAPSVSTESRDGSEWSSSEDPMELDQVDPGRAAEAPSPKGIKPTIPKGTKGIPSTTAAPGQTKVGAGRAPEVRRRSASSDSPAKSAGRTGTITGYQGTARKPSLPEKAPARPAAVVNKPTNKSSSLANKFKATRTRPQPKPVLSRVAAAPVSKVNKARTRRKTLGQVMMDPTKSPKNFSSMRIMNMARKRGIELNDAAPSNPSDIPANFLLTGDQPKKSQSLNHPKEQPPKDVDEFSERPKSSTVNTTENSVPFSGPKKVQKSVRFTEDSYDSLFDEPMDIDDPQGQPDTESPASRPSATTRKLSLANYQGRSAEKSATQAVMKQVSFGSQGSQEIRVMFHGIRRGDRPWITQFQTDEKLHFRTVCTSENFLSQYFFAPPAAARESKLSGGKLEPVPVTERTALETVAKNLSRMSLGFYLTREDYSILVYPGQCEAWACLSDPASPPEVGLCYLIFGSNLSPRHHAPLSAAITAYTTGDPNAADVVKMVLNRFSFMNYSTLLPSAKVTRGQHVFFLLFWNPCRVQNVPSQDQFWNPSQGLLARIFSLWLRACQPNCRIYTNEKDGNWRRFLDSTNAGAVILHEPATKNIRKIPRLWEAVKNGAHNFWNLSSSSLDPIRGANAIGDSPDSRVAVTLPAQLKLSIIFPRGRAFLITPSFAISEPARLCMFLDWFRHKMKSAQCVLVACADFPSYLHTLALEKAYERDEFIRENSTDLMVELLASEKGLGETDVYDRVQAWKSLRALMDATHHGFGLDETSEGIRKTVWADDLIDPNDEQSLVNWYAWWSTTRLDCYRKFYVIGSSPSGIKKAHRTARIPNYTPDTINDPDAALAYLTESQEASNAAPGPASVQVAVVDAQYVFKSRILRNDNARDFKEILTELDKKCYGSFFRLFRDPIAWYNTEMMDHFQDKDMRSHFKTFRDWFAFPTRFHQKFNTFIGLFYTIETDWSGENDDRHSPRHPWLAIYRPVNAHKLYPGYAAMELLIWDCAAKDRFPDQPTIEHLLPMQKRVIDFVREEAPKRFPDYHLERIWVGGFNVPVDAEFPVDVTVMSLEEMMGNARRWLPPMEDRLQRAGWKKLIEGPAHQVPGRANDFFITAPLPFPTGSRETAGFPKCASDTLEPGRVIFHAPRGDQSGRSACTNSLHDAARMERLKDPNCMTFKYEYKEHTLAWYHDLRKEGRAYSHIHVDMWDRVFEDIRCKWTR